VGEHTAEDRGVEGSIPSRPIVRTRDVEGEHLSFCGFIILRLGFTNAKCEQIPSRPIVRTRDVEGEHLRFCMIVIRVSPEPILKSFINYKIYFLI
jgi:hypothetical protein